MLRTFLDVRTQKLWADVNIARSMSKLEEMNLPIALGGGEKAMLRTKDSDPIIHAPSDYTHPEQKGRERK